MPRPNNQSLKSPPITINASKLKRCLPLLATVHGMLLFICSRWTSIPIIQLRRTCLCFLNVCHQSVTVVISINLVGLSATARVAQACIQSQRGRLACGLLSIKEFCVFFVSFFLLLAILDIWYIINAEEGSPGSEGRRNEEKYEEILICVDKKQEFKTVKLNREGLHNGPRGQSWSFFIITKI